MSQNCAVYRRSGDEGILSLPGIVDIFEADKVHAAALLALDDSQASTVRLDLTETGRLDVSALQILCSLRASLEASGRRLSFDEPKPELIQSTARLGISLFESL